MTCSFQSCVCMTVHMVRMASQEEHMSDGLQQAHQWAVQHMVDISPTGAGSDQNAMLSFACAVVACSQCSS